MTQVIVIHGGTTFADYDTYLEYLRTKKLYVDRFTYKPMWKELLQENLGDDFQVLLPSMPNKTNANYNEWRVWFSHVADIITDDCILIGHSLGAIFLVKYLSETPFSKRIKATILVAAPFNDESEEDLTNFKIEAVPDLFSQQAGKVTIFNGYDDPVIKDNEVEQYKKALPNAEFITLSAPDHFVRSAFPELVTKIQEL